MRDLAGRPGLALGTLRGVRGRAVLCCAVRVLGREGGGLREPGWEGRRVGTGGRQRARGTSGCGLSPAAGRVVPGAAGAASGGAELGKRGRRASAFGSGVAFCPREIQRFRGFPCPSGRCRCCDEAGARRSLRCAAARFA